VAVEPVLASEEKAFEGLKAIHVPRRVVANVPAVQLTFASHMAVAGRRYFHCDGCDRVHRRFAVHMAVASDVSICMVGARLIHCKSPSDFCAHAASSGSRRYISPRSAHFVFVCTVHMAVARGVCI
jgi:hypothetical protein